MAGRPWSWSMKAGSPSTMWSSAPSCASGSRPCARRTPPWFSPPSPWRTSSAAPSPRRSSRAARPNFLPNDRALEPQIAAAYARFGLNDRQIEILSEATPRRDYYCQSRRGNRLFDLDLGEVALAFCATSAKADQGAINHLLDRHGPAGFAAAWLSHRKLGWAADLVRTPSSASHPEQIP